MKRSTDFFCTGREVVCAAPPPVGRAREIRRLIQGSSPKTCFETISGGEGGCWRGKWGGLFWATSLEKIFGGVIAISRSAQEDGCSSLPCRGVLSFRSGAREGPGDETPRVHHAAWLSGGVATRRRRLVGDSWNNDHHMRRECMRCQSSFAFIPLMILPLATIAKAHDASRYPNLHGQWTVIITPRLEGQAVKFDPTKPWGRGQQAPLTAEYQKVHEDSMAD